jgi:hypothetical protein
MDITGLTMIPQIVLTLIPSYEFKNAPDAVCNARGGKKHIAY